MMKFRYAALLRAVNVGGTGKLPMAELKAMCSRAGFENAKTLLASGNVVFEADLAIDAARDALNTELAQYFDQEIGLFVLDAQQMQHVAEENPFKDHAPSQVGVLFVDAVPSPEDCANAKGLKDEIMKGGRGVLYIKFPSGMGQSKLVVPSGKVGTMRNMNTVSKLSALLNA